MTDPITAVLAVASLVALRFTRLDVFGMVLVGTGIYLVIDKVW